MSEEIEVHIESQQLSDLMWASNDGINYLAYLQLLKTNPTKAVKYFTECDILVRQGLGGVFNEIRSETGNFLKKIYDLLNEIDEKYLYRCIDKRNFVDFLRDGNSKNEENISTEEKAKLSRLRLDPSKVIYASPSKSKAWEFRRRQNPWIIVIYRKELFTQVEYLLWKLADGINFKDAVEAYIVIYHK